MERDNADSEDEYDEHTVNFLEKETPIEDCQERVAAVSAEVPATVPWQNMWPDELCSSGRWGNRASQP